MTPEHEDPLTGREVQMSTESPYEDKNGKTREFCTSSKETREGTS